MTKKELARIIWEEKRASRRNDITQAVNLKLSKRAAGLKDAAEEYYYDRLWAEADEFEKKYGVWPVYEMEEIEYDDPRLDIYSEDASELRRHKGEEETEKPAEEIAEVTEEELEARKIVEDLLGKWDEKFARKRELWYENPGWEAKLVHITFTLNGYEFELIPKSLGLTSDGWDQGFMESISGDIKKDLEAVGATEVYCEGFMD